VLLLLSLAFLAPGRAFDASAAEPSSCESPPDGKSAGTGDDPAAAENARGNRLARAGDPAAALEAHAEAERLARAHGERDLALRAGANAARDAFDLGQVDGLRARLVALRGETESLPAGDAQAALLLHIGRSLARLSASEPSAVADAVATLRVADTAARAANDDRLRSFALGWQGELYERGQRRAEALDLTRRALFAAQSADAVDALYRWQWQLGRLRRAEGDGDGALRQYRAAAATLARMRAEGTAPLSSDRSFARDVEPLYDELVDLLLYRASTTEDAAERHELLAEARNTIEDQKVAELRDYFQDDCLDSQRRAAPESVPGALVVYPILLPDRMELVVGSAHGLESISVPVGRARLSAEVHALRTLLEKRTTRQFLPHAEQLYDWLVRPLEARLAEPGISALVFVPSGPLRTIPLAALHDRDTHRFLIERVPLAITPGLTLTDPKRIDRANVQLLTAGVSEAVQGFPPLENVQDELAAVGEVFPGKSLLNDQFEIARFTDALETKPFGIVHIASHGEFTADASQSFLLTWDGKISMTDLAALVGVTRFRAQPLELLTLSACETAAGDERAALGLAGVAVRSGARSALATLWSVNDEASAQLLSEFYRALGDPQVSRAQALQRAQMKVMQIHRWRHPGYWSPYLLISNWL
jgi:CHAT domain-containing protein